MFSACWTGQVEYKGDSYQPAAGNFLFLKHSVIRPAASHGIYNRYDGDQTLQRYLGHWGKSIAIYGSKIPPTNNRISPLYFPETHFFPKPGQIRLNCIHTMK